MRIIPTILITLTLLTAAVFGSSQSDGRDYGIGELLQADQGAYLQKLSTLNDVDPMTLADASDYNDFPFFDSDIYEYEHRSVSKAFIYSFLVPGLGEYYVGSKWKAGLFFTIDILSWSQYYLNHSTGQDKETEFEEFADQYWSKDRYTIWLVETENTPLDTGFTHNLPSEKTQQYYEMIGKWDQFVFGWDDVDRSSESSSRRQQYLGMRGDSNNKFETARTWAMLSVANHVLSALDAALSAKRFNSRKSTFSQVNVKARLAERDGERIPQVTFTYKFY